MSSISCLLPNVKVAWKSSPFLASAVSFFTLAAVVLAFVGRRPLSRCVVLPLLTGRSCKAYSSPSSNLLDVSQKGFFQRLLNAFTLPYAFRIPWLQSNSMYSQCIRVIDGSIHSANAQLDIARRRAHCRNTCGGKQKYNTGLSSIIWKWGYRCPFAGLCQSINDGESQL